MKASPWIFTLLLLVDVGCGYAMANNSTLTSSPWFSGVFAVLLLLTGMAAIITIIYLYIKGAVLKKIKGILKQQLEDYAFFD